MKESKFDNLVWIIFAIIGAIFLVVGVIVGINVFNYDNKIETKAIITDMSTYRKSNGKRGYEVYVSYNIDGEEYESILNVYSSDFYEGKEIDIYYDKDNPHKVGVKSLDLVFLIFPAFGFVFLCIGGIGIVVSINKKKQNKKLKETGSLIYANYIETICNFSYRVNGRHPYNIICEWNNPEDGKKYIFKSKNIWLNPQNLIEQKAIKVFPIYINMENKKQYFIDIDSLTENVIDLR